ncbi:MAG: cysteine synthase A [Ruminococcaceae bacterium]|nr:cysteine synthase A [Oscillospiraceae bacterium]
MMKIYNSMEELIGRTPLVRLSRYAKAHGISGEIVAKAERFNPAGSAKDRAALFMLDDAAERGLIGEGSVIVEPTSGNTGVALAALCSLRGYRCILTMPDTMSKERRLLLAAYGAELVLTDGKLGMQGAVDKANEIAAVTEGAFIPSQFDNPSNAYAHYCTTGPEIWEDCGGEVDIFVASVGTGGTITGTARYLKEKNPSVKIIAVEPAASPLLSRGTAGPHKIQGIGANFVPSVLERGLIDEIITVTDEEAFAAKEELVSREGLLCGISSGAAVHAARVAAAREENRGKRIVVLLPDTGERYLS